MSLGQKLLQRVSEVAKDNNITEFTDKETNKVHLLIPYDGDRLLQFAYIENENVVPEQRFFARWRLNKETTRMIGETELSSVL